MKDNIPEQDPIEEYKKTFDRYMADFELSEEDLDKPLLDVGADTGEFIQYLRKVRGNTQAFGVERIRSKIDEEAEGMIVADGFNLPFDDSTFETVLAHNYIPIFVPKEKAMDAVLELLRVVKPGGKVMFDARTAMQENRNTEILRKQHPDVFTTPAQEAHSIRRFAGALTFFEKLKVLEEQGYTVEVREKDDTHSVVIVTKQ